MFLLKFGVNDTLCYRVLQKCATLVTYFILRTHTGIGVSHSQHRKTSVEVLEKMQVNGPEG